jgi:hypothetical protein
VKRAYIVAALFIVPVLAVASTFFFIPPDPSGFFWQFNLMALILYTGSAVLFLLAMRGFRQQLKVAYRFMSVGALMLMVGVFAVISSRTFLGDSLLGRIVGEFPFLFMAVFFYIGIRIFAQLITVESVFTNTKVVMIAAAVISVPAGFMPFLGAQYTFDPIVVEQMFNRILFICAAILAYRTWQATSSLYKHALSWLTGYLIVTAVMATLHIADAFPWMAPFIPLFDPAYVVAGLLLFAGAMQFNRIAYAEKSKPAVHGGEATEKGSHTSVDIIVFLASFASNPKALDIILEPMRRLTASGEVKGQLNATQQATLAKVYLQIEGHLVTKEPLRKFEQQDLRRMIELRFKDAVNEPAFWSQVPVESSHS